MQSLVSAAVIALATVYSIVAVDLTGNPSLAGVPQALVQLASALTALLWGYLWDRMGRRAGLTLALAIGLVGVGLSAAAVEAGLIWLLAIGIVGIGAARSGGQLARFIAAEVNPAEQRGSAISLVVWGGTIGAIVGPLVVGPSSRLAQQIGLGELTGPMAVAFPLMLAGALAVYFGLRPEPLEISRQVEAGTGPDGEQAGPRRSLGSLIRLPGVLVAVAAVVLAQTVMIMVMGITSLHMRNLGHGLSDISLVFSAHTLGMFAVAPLSGWLADRVGRARVMVAGALIMLLSAFVAPAAPAVSTLVAGLFLLGLGWNMCFVAGSALLADQLTLAERSRTQGANDLLIGLASAAGSLGSGIVYAALGYGTVNRIGAGFMVVVAGLSAWWLLRGRRIAQVAAGTD